MPLHGRTRLGDVFNEDVTELNFLQSKPSCFVIFGKPVSYCHLVCITHFFGVKTRNPKFELYWHFLTLFFSFTAFCL